jgi:hypothetical protein
MAGTLGLDRVVLAQPSAYRADNFCLLDMIGAASDDERNRMRAIAVLDDDTGAQARRAPGLRPDGPSGRHASAMARRVTGSV